MQASRGNSNTFLSHYNIVALIVYYSAKGDRGGSEGDEDLEEMTDSAEESEENEDNSPPPVTTPQVATPTPPAKRPGMMLYTYCLFFVMCCCFKYQYKILGICPSTPPLTHCFALSEKLGLT